MVKLFVKTNCIGSQKAEKFLKANDIRYERINLSFTPIEENLLYLMQALINNNLNDIVNFNNEIFKKNPYLKNGVLNMGTKELITYIINNPQILSYPIAFEVSDKNVPLNLLIGYNPYSWRILIPDESKEELTTSYNNISKGYLFSTCCFYDQVDLDDVNILVNLEKNKENK